MTETRAKYGLLKPVIDKIYNSNEFGIIIGGYRYASFYRVWTDVQRN